MWALPSTLYITCIVFLLTGAKGNSFIQSHSFHLFIDWSKSSIQQQALNFTLKKKKLPPVHETYNAHRP